MGKRFELRLNAPEGSCIYKLIVQLTSAFVGDADEDPIKTFYRELAERALEQHAGDVDAALATISMVKLIMALEQRSGCPKEKYGLPWHEVVELIYNRVMGN